MFVFPLDTLPYFQNYAFRERFFSPEECDRALSLMNQHPLSDVSIRKEDGAKPGGDLHKARLKTLPWVREAEWMYQKLTAAVQECNKALYGFQLTGFAEGLQLGQYAAGALHDWHHDFGPREQSVRKISVIVQLSDPTQYEGGDVEFFSANGSQKATRTRGALLIFPAFTLFRVAPVISGVRSSITGWVAGIPFR